MNNGKVRIYELSKELNLDNRDVLAICKRLNIPFKSHSSTITAEQAKAVSEAFQGVSQGEVTARSESKQTLSPPAASGSGTAGSGTLISTVSGVQHLALRRISRTSQGYIEPLLKVADALPLHMVLIPGGIFTMGSPDDELQREKNEGPQHEVTVPQFFMGRYPVTQAQWRAVAILPQIERELDPDPSRFKGDNHPVEQVTWYDAVEFCQRLAQHTGRPYRLPTEAEWEYACRAGTTTPFYFGKTLTTEVANYNGKYAYNDGPKGEYREATTPVDHFGIANAFGLSDMHGNVYEWCQDHFHSSYEGAPTDGSAWVTDDENKARILRGGSWVNDPRYCRSACRSNSFPDFRNSDIGFRVSCSAPRTQ